MEEIIIPDLLRHEKARAMYVALCSEYMSTHGVDVIPDSSLALICDICLMEQVKLKLLEDVEKRPVEHIKNGRQEYWKPNAGIAEINRLSGSQRRNLAELKLTPASRKGAIDAPTDDDFANY